MDGIELREKDGRIVVPVKAIPGVRASALAGVRNGELVVKVAAQPEKGKANDELERYLAGLLGLPRSAVAVVGGQTSHHKKLAVPTSTRTALEALLAGQA